MSLPADNPDSSVDNSLRFFSLSTDSSLFICTASRIKYNRQTIMRCQEKYSRIQPGSFERKAVCTRQVPCTIKLITSSGSACTSKESTADAMLSIVSTAAVPPVSTQPRYRTPSTIRATPRHRRRSWAQFCILALKYSIMSTTPYSEKPRYSVTRLTLTWLMDTWLSSAWVDARSTVRMMPVPASPRKTTPSNGRLLKRPLDPDFDFLLLSLLVQLKLFRKQM